MRLAYDCINSLGGYVASLFGEKVHLPYAPKKIEDLFKIDNLADILPFETFDSTTGLFKHNKSVGFIIEAKPIVGGDDKYFKVISSFFEDFFWEHANLQFLFFADNRIKPFLEWWNKSKQDGIYSELAQHRQNHFESGESTARVFRFFLSYSIPLQYADDKKLMEYRDRILKLLQTITIAQCIGPQAFIETAEHMLNFKASTELVRRKHNVLDILSNQLDGGGEIAVKKDGVYFNNDIIFKSFITKDVPDRMGPLSLQNLIGDAFRDNYRLNFPFFLHYGVHFPNQSSIEKSFNLKTHLIEQQGKSSKLLRMIPELVTELRECDLIRRQIAQGAKFVLTQFSTGFWCPTSHMFEAEQSLKTLYKTNNFNLFENKYVHLPHLLSILPSAWAEYIPDLKKLKVLKTTITTECPPFIPIQGEWSGTPSQGMLLIGRRGQFLNWNNFDNHSGNYNAIVVGPSGSCKSVFMQDFIFNQLRTGAKVFIFDVGRSYEKLCNLVNGQHLEFSSDTSLCLNPFSNLSLQTQEQMESNISFLKSIIGCMASPSEKISDYENAILETAIQQALQSGVENHSITNISKILLSSKNEKSQMLGTMLTPYTKNGVYSKYFEGVNNINFDNQLVLCELEELKEKKDLQAVVLQLLIMKISNQAFLGDRTTPFIICIDEAWDLLRAPQTANFIETLARRLRKYRGALVTATQSLEDFSKSPGAMAAFENSDWGCFLPQKKGSISKFVDSGKLQNNPALLNALESLATIHGKYSEVLITDPNGNFSIARLLLDEFSKLLYSTQAADYAKIKQLVNTGLTELQAINQIISKGRG